jgi:hypothetical protein
MFFFQFCQEHVGIVAEISSLPLLSKLFPVRYLLLLFIVPVTPSLKHYK